MGFKPISLAMRGPAPSNAKSLDDAAQSNEDALLEPAPDSRRRIAGTRWVFPACDALKLPHATWLTFRRTYCSLSRASRNSKTAQISSDESNPPNAGIVVPARPFITVSLNREGGSCVRNSSLPAPPLA